MKNYETLIIESNEPVLTVILNRPQKANAMSKQMIEELMDVLIQLRYEERYKYVVFTGSGKYFTGGADLSEFLTDIESGTFTPSANRLLQMYGQEFMQKIENLEQITITAINGPMYGAGVALALCCDFRIMAENSIICVPEAERGTFFTWGSTPRLVSIVGPAKAKELIMLCNPVTAMEAQRIGFANQVVADEALIDSVQLMIASMERSPFLPLRLTKKIVNAAAAPTFGNILPYEPELMEQVSMSGDFQNGINQFLKSKKNSIKNN
nr:enoyl-CoA hydratase/isomerase family protein [Fredinandcohnia onubensis]